MQTVKLTLSIDATIVVPEQFLNDMRSMANATDASPFLVQLQASTAEDDDAFIEGILKNGCRIGVRHALLDLLANSGLGGRVSPASVDVLDVSDAVATAMQDKQQELTL